VTNFKNPSQPCIWKPTTSVLALSAKDKKLCEAECLELPDCKAVTFSEKGTMLKKTVDGKKKLEGFAATNVETHIRECGDGKEEKKEEEKAE